MLKIEKEPSAPPVTRTLGLFSQQTHSSYRHSPEPPRRSAAVVIRGRRGRGKVEKGKGGQIYSDRKTQLWVPNTQCNAEMMEYRIVYLEPV